MLNRFAAACLLAGAASAAGAEVWSFTLATSGEDVFWMSPTAVDPSAPRYDATYEITEVLVDFTFSGIPFTNQNVTSDLPAELRMNAGCAVGPAPLLLIDERIEYPEPPETPGLAADIRIELDALGFGQASATNVLLGDLQVNLPVFGLSTVTLTRVSISGTIEVVPELSPEDFNDEGVLNSSDLGALLAAWGACPTGVLCPADLNCDGVVNALDLGALLAAWG